MEPKVKMFEKFTALIKLTKKRFFGLQTESKTIWVTSNFKIIKSDSDLPFKKGDILDIIVLKKFIIDNHYNFSFNSRNSFLKRELYWILEDINLFNIQKKKYASKIKICLY